MQCLVFDDDGAAWDAGSPALAGALQASIHGATLTDYAIRNLGFIAAGVANGSARIRLRPSIVSQIALSGLLYWLHDQPLQRVLISFLDGDWSHELVPSREEAVDRLLARLKVSNDDRSDDFLHQRLSLHELPDTSPLWAMLQAWSGSGGIYDRERMDAVLTRAVGGRYMLVEANRGSANLLVKDIGSGFNKNTVRWLSRIRGLRVEDQPDYAYGKWISGLYRQAMTHAGPSLEDVDAVIRWPQQPRMSYRYRRLVVPFQRGPDSTLLLGATVLDSSINLRVKAP